jgi:Arc/MetJ-type ribon-helix-helix transcriptional regulator
MAKPKTMETRKLVSMPAQLANAIEDYRYTNRIPSDSEAIRRLIEAGLKAIPAQAEPAPARQRKR